MPVASPQPVAQTLPRHIAIIMDGNGRWAKARSLPRLVGHQRGAEAVREVVVTCRDMGIGYLTLYAFSSENWKRPATEVGDLMDLLRFFIRRELEQLQKKGVRIRIIGDRERLAPDIIELIDSTQQRTAGNRGLTLVIALNYGSHNEILAACRRLATEAAAGTLDPAAIDENLFRQHLHTADIPDPDLLIRTSGEQRLSNFLLWQAAYAELVFVDTLWPDFGRAQLQAAVAEFQRRERRYGASGE